MLCFMHPGDFPHEGEHVAIELPGWLVYMLAYVFEFPLVKFEFPLVPTPSNHCSSNQFLAQIAAILTLPVTEVLHFVLVC